MTGAHFGRRCSERQLQEGESDAKVEQGTSEDNGTDQVDLSSHAHVTGQQTDRNQGNRIGDDALRGRSSILFDNWQHLDAALLIIFPIEPCNREKVRKLPDK